MKIYQKVLLFILPLILLPALLVGLISHRVAGRALQSDDVAESELAAAMNRLNACTLLVVAGSLVGGTVILLILARRFTAPIHVLIDGTNRVRQGELDVHIPITTGGEIGILTGAFNAMTAQLRRLVGDLEQRVAELRRTERALRRSEKHYRSLFDGVPMGLYRTTPEGRFLDVNPALVQMLGYADRESLLAVGVEDIYVDAEDRRRWKTTMAREEIVRDFEIHCRRQDGAVIWAKDSSRTVREADGRIVYYEGSLEDITERKRAELDREVLIAELEARNAELERFSYTVFHDLKNPVTTIGWFLGSLERDIDAGDVGRSKADVARISRAVANMRRLLDDLLEFSRIGRLVNPPEEVSMGRLVGEAVSALADRLEERNVQVEIAPDLLVANGPMVYGDRSRLLEMVQNLVDNAAKFMGDQPCPRIEIGVRRNGEEIVFCVQDNGIGIDPRYHERIFGLFDKLDPETEGAGVGLTLVKRIVEVHGGHIWVESEGVGKGSTFCFTLPDNRTEGAGEEAGIDR